MTFSSFVFFSFSASKTFGNITAVTLFAFSRYITTTPKVHKRKPYNVSRLKIPTKDTRIFFFRRILDKEQQKTLANYYTIRRNRLFFFPCFVFSGIISGHGDGGKPGNTWRRG